MAIKRFSKFMERLSWWSFSFKRKTDDREANRIKLRAFGPVGQKGINSRSIQKQIIPIDSVFFLHSPPAQSQQRRASKKDLPPSLGKKKSCRCVCFRSPRTVLRRFRLRLFSFSSFSWAVLLSSAFS